MWNIEGMLMAAFVILPLAAVFAQPAGLGQSEMKKVSSAQDLLVKSEVETAISMLQTISAKQKKGELTMEQAKQLGADLLRGLRYCQDGYFYANTTDGVNIVMYGRKDFEGKNKLDLRDAKGNFFVREYMAKAKAGELNLAQTIWGLRSRERRAGGGEAPPLRRIN